MSFNENARLDSSRVSDRRGRGKGIAVGGGLGGGLILILSLIFGSDVVDGLGLSDGGSSAGSGYSESISECLDGADANERLDCRIVGTAESLDSYWGPALAAEGMAYTEPGVVLFSGRTDTGCGSATSAVGPFYCPADEQTYYDTAFFDELVARYGASGGPLAQEYVVAHEFGHHIQNLTGVLGASASDPRGADSAAVRTELQADCYAGLWAGNAASVPAPGSTEPFLAELTAADVQDALSAAAAIGDDRIQSMAAGQVNPESWTHGSGDQRQAWFMQGYDGGTIASCNTFSAPDLDNP
ncbi:neutral zinc metallopeptidase [Arthrobacter sp. APC 3897]|uniref:KPN_02809 family neutral zinc metallopeptidase n=1 Tax=Arthrobacter sp. APC 3897 TaxID=3035204 RepID=UPI0025B4BF8A|nr:neutral zinc metallopeptidase [Arthrobacter sp. APC 3897]MDN3480446.1 neutral zinc metallopeptidase [Arthrobacter sp. APC 3897]